jgi:hypothetical protein
MLGTSEGLQQAQHSLKNSNQKMLDGVKPEAAYFTPTRTRVEQDESF